LNYTRPVTATRLVNTSRFSRFIFNDAAISAAQVTPQGPKNSVKEGYGSHFPGRASYLSRHSTC